MGVTDVSFFNVSSNVTVDEGGSFHLNCTPQGNPLLPEVTWIKAPVESEVGKPVQDEKRIVISNDNVVVSLRVVKSISSDMGYYQCQFPGVGNPVRSNKIRVTINGKDTWLLRIFAFINCILSR